MDFIDQTPFAALPFESLTLEDEPFLVIPIRGTFEIIQGERLKPLPDQAPVVLADEYYGEPSKSSLKCANDLAPFKPNSDIIVTGTARSHRGISRTSWDVNISVGKLRKSFLVTGPRSWIHTPVIGWRLSEPEPCEQVPLRYELASGGQWQHEQEGGAWEENPVGCGFASKRHLDTSHPISAPQIVPIDGHIPPFSKAASPDGCGPLAPSWLQRRRYAGTYDEEWQRNRAPLQPRDFKFDYYNAAHPDLIYPGYLQGDETVQIVGISPTGPLQFTLPGYDIGAVITDKNGYRFSSFAQLDTLEIDADNLRASLVWRIAAPVVGAPIEEVVLKMRESIPQPALAHG